MLAINWMRSNEFGGSCTSLLVIPFESVNDEKLNEVLSEDKFHLCFMTSHFEVSFQM